MVPAARRVVLDSQFAAFGSPVALTTIAGTAATVGEALAALRSVADLLAGEVVPLDAAASSLTTDPPESLDARLVYNLSNFSTYLLYRRRVGSGDVAVTLHLPSLGTPMVRSLADQTVTPPRSLTHATADAQLITATCRRRCQRPDPRLQLRSHDDLRAA